MRFPTWLAVAAFLTAAPCAAAPLEAYGNLPAMGSVRVSPDGRLIAYASTTGNARKVVVEDVGSRQARLQLNAGDHKLRALQWAGSGHLIVTISRSGFVLLGDSGFNEWFVAEDVDLKSGVQRPLLTAAYSLNAVAGVPAIRYIEGKPVAFVVGTSFVRGVGRPAVFRVDIDAYDRGSLRAVGFPDTTGFVVSPRGDVIAQTEYDAAKQHWSLDLWKDSEWRQFEQADTPIDTPEMLGLGRDGESILVGGQTNGQDTLRELRADGSKMGDPFTVGDMERLIWDAATYRLIGDAHLTGDDDRYTFFDASDQKTWERARAAFAGARVGLESISDDHKRLVVRVDSPREGPAYALVDVTAGTATWIGSEHPELKSEDIAPVRPFVFKAADGLPLTGYLTLPRGRNPKKLPLVVLPHGGPAARDAPGFDWWAQAMASRGYAILQVNYRGSDGLGRDFMTAGFGQWGREMQTDLSDGVRHLVAEGTVDPARVCIVGASYGGYAALAGATLDPGVYRCAVSVAGPADLRKFVNWSKSREGARGIAAKRYWTRYMGDETILAEISPAEQAGNATVPILLIHGKDDTVVPYEQSQMMADALRKAGKPVEFVTLSHEDHWLSRGETRLEMLRATVAFLEKNNPSQ